MKKTSEIHTKEAKRILRYVIGTINFSICYYTSKRFELVGSSDVDWGGSLDYQESKTGDYFYVFMGLNT